MCFHNLILHGSSLHCATGAKELGGGKTERNLSICEEMDRKQHGLAILVQRFSFPLLR